MKFFNVFLIFFFLFFVGCGDDGVKRVSSGSETDGESQSDGDSADTDSSDDADSTDIIPVDDADSSDTNPDDDADSSNTITDDDAETITDDDADTKPDDTKPDGDDLPSDEDVDTDTSVELTDEEKCLAAGGTWDFFAEEDFERCYKIVDCAPKPENTEWRGDQSYTEYYDVNDEQWTVFGNNYKTEYNDEGDEAMPCQYVCAANALREEDECKPYCSAVFNGESSRIEIANNDLLNPGSDSWTIEAWIKQDEGDLTSDYAPILRKGTSENPSYVLMGYRRQQSWSSVTYTVTGATTYKSAYGSTTENLQVDGTFNEFSGGWTHIAMVHNKNVEGTLIQSITYKITLYVNGKQVNSKTYEPRTSMNLLEVNEPLIIGANLYSSWSVSKKYFKGLIDSIRISGSERYTADFTPLQLSADGDTIAFWDFNNNFDETKNGLQNTPTNVTFSTDCAF